jgi:hypothetical protein
MAALATPPRKGVLVSIGRPGTRRTVEFPRGVVIVLRACSRSCTLREYRAVHDQSHQGEHGVFVCADRPRQYLGIMDTTPQALEAGDVLQSPFADAVHLQAALIPGQDDISRASRAVGARELVEAKVESLVARLHTGLRLDGKV